MIKLLLDGQLNSVDKGYGSASNVFPSCSLTSKVVKYMLSSTDYLANYTEIYGGPTDTWGQALSYLDLNNPYFGVAISVTISPDFLGYSEYAYINSIQMRVYYRDSSTKYTFFFS